MDDILKLTKGLISVPSVTGINEELAEVLRVAEKYLSGHNFTPFASNNTPSLLYSNKGTDAKEFKIILNAHLDVVPAKKEQFHAYEKDGKLYGRGAYDMKAAGAVMICLFTELATKLPYALGLQLVTDEESGGFDGTKYQIDQKIRADFTIVGEGTNFRIINENKSIMDIKLVAKGKTAHSAYPWLGKNAILRLYEALSRITDLYPTPKEETFETTASITRVESDNHARNVVPEDCTAYLNFRYTANEEDTIVPKLRSILPEDVTLEVLHKDIPRTSDPEGFYLSGLRQTAENVLQTNVSLARAHGSSDTRYFRNVECDAVEFGPVGHGHHSDEEWVDIKSLEYYYKILKTFLLSLK